MASLTQIGTVAGSKPLTWEVEYVLPAPNEERELFGHYRQTAHSCTVTDGGVLLFHDAAGRVTVAVGPTGWTQVTQA